MKLLCTYKIKIESQNLEYGRIKDQWPNQDPKLQSVTLTTSSLQSPKSGLKGHGHSLHLKHQERATIWNSDAIKTSDYSKIKIKMPNPSQALPASSKALRDGKSLHLQNQDREPKFRTMVYENQWPNPYQDQDAKPQSETSRILQSWKSGLKDIFVLWELKGHGCSLHLHNQDRAPKFGTWVYQRPVTIFKKRSRSQTPVRNL